jgi:hypothetical protein
MLNDRQLGGKAQRYARAAFDVLRVTERHLMSKQSFDRVQKLIEAAYFNGHRSGEALTNRRREGEAWKKKSLRKIKKGC